LSDARLKVRGGGGMTRKQAGELRPCLLLDLSPAVASLDWAGDLIEACVPLPDTALSRPVDHIDGKEARGLM
jgi:hypothetical protein